MTRTRQTLWGGLAALLLVLVGLFIWLIEPDLPTSLLYERYLGPDSQIIEIDGVQIHVVDQGAKDAPAILLLHGTFSSLQTWDQWAKVLVSDYRVIRLDLPGFGLTGPHPEGDYSLASHLRLFEALRAELVIERWSVAGNSLGAGYALAYAQHFPDRVNALGLLNGGRVRLAKAEFAANQAAVMDAQRQEQGSSWVRMALNQPWIRSLMRTMTPRFLVHAALEDVYADPRVIDDALVRRYHDLLRREGNRQAFLDRVAGRRDGQVADEGLPDPLPPEALSIPILIQWGGQDRWIPLFVGEKLADVLPTAQLIVYQNLGHVPMEEAPMETVTDFKLFLDTGLTSDDQASWSP